MTNPTNYILDDVGNPTTVFALAEVVESIDAVSVAIQDTTTDPDGPFVEVTGSEYVIAGVGDPGGITVTFTTAPGQTNPPAPISSLAINATLKIQRTAALARVSDFSNSLGYTPETFNREYDHQLAAIGDQGVNTGQITTDHENRIVVLETEVDSEVLKLDETDNKWDGESRELKSINPATAGDEATNLQQVQDLVTDATGTGIPTGVEDEVAVMRSGAYAPDTLGEASLKDNAVTLAKLAGGAANQVYQTDGAGDPVLAGTLPSHSHTLADVTDSGALAALNTVDTAEIEPSAVTGVKIANNNVDTQHIAPDAITNTEIDANAVGTTQIADGAVTEAKLNSGTAHQVFLRDASGDGDSQFIHGQNIDTNFVDLVLPADPDLDIGEFLDVALTDSNNRMYYSAHLLTLGASTGIISYQTKVEILGDSGSRNRPATARMTRQAGNNGVISGAIIRAYYINNI